MLLCDDVEKKKPMRFIILHFPPKIKQKKFEIQAFIVFERPAPAQNKLISNSKDFEKNDHDEDVILIFVVVGCLLSWRRCPE
jgi:hypothetical protein